MNKNLVISAALISGLALAQSTWPSAPTSDGKPKLLETHAMTGNHTTVLESESLVVAI